MRNPLGSSKRPPGAELEAPTTTLAELVAPQCGTRSSLGHRCEEPAGHAHAHRYTTASGLVVRWGAEHEPVSPPIVRWGP